MNSELSVGSVGGQQGAAVGAPRLVQQSPDDGA